MFYPNSCSGFLQVQGRDVLVSTKKKSTLPDNVLETGEKKMKKSQKRKQVKSQEMHSVPVTWLQSFQSTCKSGQDQVLSSALVL